MIVAFTVSGQRPHYLARTLESWQRVRGQIKYLFVAEPGSNRRTLDLIEPLGEIITTPARPDSSPPLFRATLPTRTALEAGQARDGYTVLAEEDFLVSADVIEYMSWARDTYRDDPSVTAVCTTHGFTRPDAQPADVERGKGFRAGVWATWSDRSLACWAESGRLPWDLQLRDQIRAEEKYALFPVQARSTHIGETSTLVLPDVSALYWPGSQAPSFRPDADPCEYREVQRS